MITYHYLWIGDPSKYNMYILGSSSRSQYQVNQDFIRLTREVL